MYNIRKIQLTPTKISLNRCSSLGLGITILQFFWGLYNVCHLQEKNTLLDIETAELQLQKALDCRAGEQRESNSNEPCTLKLNLAPSPQQEFRRCLVIGVILYTQLFLNLLDVYLYMILRSATQKENICKCWLGLYLQISLLTYNMIEILIVANNGVFDGSSCLLAARATVRAISIEMICLFLREIEDKQETDLLLYIILIV
ncbi:unnamed protein product [Orchesella dallaii]|uniref:Uncharacterized protein n=1 Tax=Orchesella dallaii TaxID=48710 RepID=A0ABP1QEB1_9HEXA